MGPIENVAWLSLAVATLAFSVSAFTLWLTHFRRGRVIMTRPTVIFFGPDGSRNEGLNENQKIFLRALLISDSKRGRIIQTLYATLSHKEARQNFHVWVYGDDRLVRGSGLHINDTGLATNHHFLMSDKNGFQFREGVYILEVYAEILGDRAPTRLLSQSVRVSSEEASNLETGECGLYFDWGPQSGQYHSHIDRKPPSSSDQFKDTVLAIMEGGANSSNVPKNAD